MKANRPRLYQAMLTSEVAVRMYTFHPDAYNLSLSAPVPTSKRLEHLVNIVVRVGGVFPSLNSCFETFFKI